ncbi:hypothetical protein SORBI_3001G051100 [Sorghum bicolor]|uniref:Glycine-rich protein n=1 Tax=Sorghum bicolor TaxID=4558 RepID=A0A1Z5S4G6_SORBI|nr:hypothetical protein SORBI_3001G051100 [Sorghum bicolor]
MASKGSIAFAMLCVALALALHAATAAARTVPAVTGVSSTTVPVPGGVSSTSTGGTASLPVPAASAGTKNDHNTGSGGAGVADKKNLFVGVGGMGDLPGFPAVGAGYGVGFGNNGGGVFSGVTGPLGGVGGGVGGVGPLGGVGGFGPLGGGGGGIPFGGFGGGGTPFGGGYGGGGAGGVTP